MPLVNFKDTVNMSIDCAFASKRTIARNAKIRNALNFAGNKTPPKLSSCYTYPKNLTTTVAVYAPVYDNETDETKIFNLIQTLMDASISGSDDFFRIKDPYDMPLIKEQAMPMLQQITGNQKLDIQAALGSGCTAGKFPHQDNHFLATWFLSVKGPRTHHLPTKDSNTIVQSYKEQGLSVNDANEKLGHDMNTLFSDEMKNMTETPYGNALVTTSGEHQGGGAVHQAVDCTGYTDRCFITVSTL